MKKKMNFLFKKCDNIQNFKTFYKTKTLKLKFLKALKLDCQNKIIIKHIDSYDNIAYKHIYKSNL